MEVKMNQYVFSHGKNPKGQGYWIFQIGTLEECKDWFSHNGTYAEAAKAAKRKAKDLGQTYVTVLP